MEPTTEPTGLPTESLPPRLDARERQINDDYEWCLHDPEVRSRYSGQVVVARHRRILGAGRNFTEAWENAQRAEPPPQKGYVAFVVIPGGAF